MEITKFSVLPSGTDTTTGLVFYPLSTHILELFGLQEVELPFNSDPLPESSVASAAISATLQDNQGNSVAGCQNVSLHPIGSPPSGDYAGEFGPAFNPAPGDDYLLIVNAVSSVGSPPQTGQWEFPVQVQERRVN